MHARIHKIYFIAATVFLILGSVIITCNRSKKSYKSASESTLQKSTAFTSEYVGRESCKSCHEKQYDLFSGSDHDLAMDSATTETVLGDFNNVVFTHLGITSHFYARDGKYFIHTEGPDGKFDEYEVKYTFGIRPLQQYLVEFAGGRYQMLPLCWDTRPRNQGGQRWFHIYNQERISPEDLLYWTHITQNWNYMCSECHSTHVRKNYDYSSDTYNTTWTEIDVSCESCHGPGSKHITWAEEVEKGGKPDLYPDMGLNIRLKDTDQATWVFNLETGTAIRSVPRRDNILVEMCSRCHSRRSIISEDYIHGKSFLNTHQPGLLVEHLYFPDGQILEEVYVYGSFLQSKMYRQGVVCKDCHEPHSGKVFIHNNALCYRCHLAEKYGSREHHFHDPAQNGSSCFECHMPERTYMVIDPRRDHSIRIPRPDLSDKLGTPNACISCHTDKTNDWAAEYVNKWYGLLKKGKKHFGEIFWAGRQGYPEAHAELIQLAEDKTISPMIRATALSLLINYPDPATDNALRNASYDPDPLIRYAAVLSMETANPESIRQITFHLLTDSVRLVRTLAAKTITRIPNRYLNRSTLAMRDRILEEYIQTQMINADHPSAHMNLGILYLNLGDFANAEASYKKAIEIEPAFTTSYINLADLYRVLGRDQEGEKVLRDALNQNPNMAVVHYALGLLLVRKENREEAMNYLQKAAGLEPANARFTYAYGVGLYSNGQPEEAINYLESALLQHPYDRDILYSLATFNREQGNLETAMEYAKRLVEYYPVDPDYRQLLQYLQSSAN